MLANDILKTEHDAEVFMNGFVLGDNNKKAVIKPITITQNGTYSVPKGINGYNPIVVKVKSGSGDTRLAALLNATELANIAVTDEWSVSVRMSDELNGDFISSMDFSSTGNSYTRLRDNRFWTCYFKNGAFMFAIPTMLERNQEDHYTPKDSTEYMSYSYVFSDYSISNTGVSKYSSGNCNISVSYTAAYTKTFYNSDGSISGTPSTGQINVNDVHLNSPTDNSYYDPYQIAITRNGADTYIGDVWDFAQAVAASVT